MLQNVLCKLIFVAILAGVLGESSFSQSRVARALVGDGETITKLAESDLPGFDVGYWFRQRSILWIDFWTWSGSYCLFQGDEYVLISREDAEKLARRSLSPPFLYHVPLGWLLTAGFSSCLGLVALRNRKHDQARQNAVNEAFAFVARAKPVDPKASAIERAAASEEVLNDGVRYLVRCGASEADARSAMIAAMRGRATI